jgi:hypothetical protein
MWTRQRIIRHLLIAIAAVSVIVVSGYVTVLHSDAYQAAQQYVTTHPRVVAILGEGVDTRLRWGGRFRVKVSEPYRWMRLVLVAKGRKASGVATVEISTKDSATWIVEKAELSSPEGEVNLSPATIR